MTLDEMLKQVHPDEVRAALRGLLSPSTLAIYYSIDPDEEQAAIVSTTLALSPAAFVSIRMESRLERQRPGSRSHKITSRHAVPLSAIEGTWIQGEAGARRNGNGLELRECRGRIDLDRPFGLHNQKEISLPLNEENDYDGGANQAQKVLSFVRSVEQAIGG